MAYFDDTGNFWLGVPPSPVAQVDFRGNDRFELDLGTMKQVYDLVKPLIELKTQPVNVNTPGVVRSTASWLSAVKAQADQHQLKGCRIAVAKYLEEDVNLTWPQIT